MHFVRLRLERMQDVLKDIQSGAFTKEFIDDYRQGRPKLNAHRQKWTDHPLEVVGQKLRGMMPWLDHKSKKAA